MEGRPMVSYLTGVMNSLVDRLTKLEVHHPKLKNLWEDLENLKKDLLDEFAGRGAKDKQVKVWIKQVRELVYDIDDWIEPEPPTNLGESEIKQIEEFKAQIQEARERCTRYDLPKKVPTSDADLSYVGRSKVTIDSRLLSEEKTVLVAVDVAKNELEKHLMNEEKKLKVVCVVGMDGYGKTSIAKEIYGKLGRQFDCQAFVSVGRRPSMKSTLMDILRQVNPQDEREYWDVQPVIAELWKFLGTKRYFIVIDDLRSTWAWKVINSALPDKNHGSRVLTTTCIMDVAKSCSNLHHGVEALSELDSISLFRSRISIREEERPAGFKEVTDDMLKMCGGMPLAIIVTAGLLTRKSAELGPSKRLEKYTLSASDQYSTSQGMRNILDMSYADLSLPVKSCFLYVSVFPENYTIKKDRLIRVWVAEGFIPKRDEENSWETGESYFNELISRRLIQPVFDYDDGQAVGCTVHGVILDYISSLSSEENFVTAGAELRSGPFPCDTIRRFSLDCSNQEEDDTLASTTVHISKVRSLIFFGDIKRMPDETWHCLRFLRVLDLKDTENLGNRHLEGIGRLVLLRYLGLGGTDIEELPEEIGKLQRLETLDLRRTIQLRTLPASIVRLRRLVSLLGERVQLPSGIGNMQDLEELSTIDGARSLDSVEELLAKSKRLRMLGIHWGVYYHYAPDRETTETYRRSVMSFLKEAGKSNLQSLFLYGYREGVLLGILLDSWVPPHHLRRFELTISGPLRGVPPKMASLVNLTQLRISIDEVEAEGLDVLGGLPNLILLKLESRGIDAERRVIVSRHGFRCLVVFSYKCAGMGLQFTPGAMPQLRRLRIEFSASETVCRYGDLDFGIQHLSCLTRFHAAIHCQDARKSLEEVEAAITEQVSKNSNSPVLELTREIIAPQEEHETVQESYEQESRISDKDFDEEHATLQKQHEIMQVDVDSNTNKQADSRVSTLLSESSSHLVNPDTDDVHEYAAKLGFEKVSEQIIDEYKSTAVLYKHKKTGSEVMSVSNDDENKVFGIVFRTPPKNSTGIPHILQHSVLCGSRKYPLKQPFVELLKSSLHTFLNAFTCPDRTCYPVASTNTKDFYNLVDVYLDAVFFPRCVEDFQTFQQEGWHYELDNPEEEISYKGVVFNQMKGVYSQPDNIMGRVSQQALFPENPYGVDSGGDPNEIPKLTFEEFKEFHKYYHPSNARIWFYGDDDPKERIRILSEYLDQFEASSVPNDSKVWPQRLFKEPVRIVEKYPAGQEGDLKKKYMVCINWLLSEEPLDVETQLTLGLLDHLLLGTPASPLRRILLESGLGDAIVGGGVEDELLQPRFSVGLKGVSEDNIQKVEELVMQTLKNLAEERFALEAVEASMNTIEFALRENNEGSFPRGLSLMLRSIGKWIYDMDPFEPLKYERPLQQLKARIAEEGSKAVFTPLIEKFILTNAHRVTVEMQPDHEKASRDEAAEKEILKQVKSSMTQEDLAELTRATKELKDKQETPDPPEALKAVPSLSLQDIPKKPIHVPIEVGEINGVKVLQHDLFTNDVVYCEVVFDMSSMKKEHLQLLPLF